MPRGPLAATGLAALLVLGFAYVAAAGQEETPPASAPSSGEVGAPAAPPGGAGMVIYRDPSTGRLGVPPAGAARPAPRAGAGGVERQGITAGGGVLLDGLPWNTMSATRDAAGGTATRCERKAGEQ
jgi:hypothetical protein